MSRKFIGLFLAALALGCGGKTGIRPSNGQDEAEGEADVEGEAEVAGEGEGEAEAEGEGDPCPDGCGISCASAFPVIIPACRIPADCGEHAVRLDGTILYNHGWSTLTDPEQSVTAAVERMEAYDIEAACNVEVGDTVYVFNGNPRQPLGWTLRGLLDPESDGTMAPLMVHVPVVQHDDCSSHSPLLAHTVVGFAVLRIEDVQLPSEGSGYLDAAILCGEAERPCGGGDFGLRRTDCSSD